MNSNENATVQPLKWFPGLQLSACLFYTLILLVGITGNILVLIIVAKYREMRNATNLLLANLSVADLFLLLFCIADGYQHLYGKDKHRLGTFMCRFSPFVQNATATCSVLTIMAISYERYVAICQPLKTSSLRLTLFRTLPTVIFFWFVSCIVSSPFFIFSSTDVVNSTYNETIVTCFTHFSRSWSIGYLVPCTLCLYLIILVLLCYWHYSICYILFNREALLRDNTIVTRYRRQVAQLLIVVIISFFLLILPHKIWAIIQNHLSPERFFQLGFHLHSFIIITTRSLLYLNSAINPLLYSIMSTKFRQSFVRLLKEFRGSTKDHRSSPVHFSKDYPMRAILLGANRSPCDGTMTSAIYNGNQGPERRLLLAENTPTPMIETNKFLFPAK